ncbi:MAG: hypothetical protein C0471_20360 [Erythrobacter sp.]|nr:hypothetical protein [Erythrobacter sp.]
MSSRVPRSAGTPWLIAGAALSAAAALLHVGVIAGGPDWYRFFGAGERMAQMATRGHWYPPVVTTGIAIVLAGWALVALSGAGLTVRVPLLRTGLTAITAIYLARGLLIVPVAMFVPYPEGAFDYWSSLIVLVYGLVYAIGLWRAWPALRPRPKSSIA